MFRNNITDIQPLINFVSESSVMSLMLRDNWTTVNETFLSSFIASSGEVITEMNFEDECFTTATEKLLCENTAVQVNFGCDFPSNFSTMNAVTHFSNVEITHITVTCIAFLVAFAGNLLVVTTAPFDVSMKSPINLFLVNLSLADILVSIVCLWDNAIRSLSYNYMLGPFGCKAGGFIHMTCLLVSVLTLTGITIDRVYAVLLPLKARNASPRLKWVLGFIWLVSITFAAPFSALREYRIYKWKDIEEIQCTYSRGEGLFDRDAKPRCQLGTNYVNVYHILVTLLLFFIPVIVILLAYFLIILRLWRSSSSLVEDSRTPSTVHMEVKKKVVRLALVVLIAFLICWTPLQVVILMSVFGDNKYVSLSKDRHLFWIYFLAYTNSALNPIIYGGFSKSYRATIFKILRRGKKRKYSSNFHGRSRGTVSISFSPRSERISLRQRATSIVQTSFKGYNNCKVQVNQPPPPTPAEVHVMTTDMAAAEDAVKNNVTVVENEQEKMPISENIEQNNLKQQQNEIEMN